MPEGGGGAGEPVAVLGARRPSAFFVAIHRSAILFYKKLKTDSSLGSGGIQEERRDRLPAEIGADGLMHPVIGGALL